MAETTAQKQKILIPDNDQARTLVGRQEANLKAIERQLDVHVAARGNELTVTGDPDNVERVVQLFDQLMQLADQGHVLAEPDVLYAVRLAREGKAEALTEIFKDVLTVTARGKQIRPKTLGQKRYVEAMRTHSLVFGLGPAGTGKTYLAMAQAITAFKNRQVSRIILTRPAVEAGEKLGFLPGDLQDKVDPYLRPLYDALWDILGVDTFEKYMGRGMIEVAPLAYMRGRTLDDSYVILDEAQNTTPEQMKMFLTRLGFGSRAVVTGDQTQVDLPRDQHSGLAHVQRVVEGIEGIAFVRLTERDVVRHPLVQSIIQAYDRYEEKNEEPRPDLNGIRG